MVQIGNVEANINTEDTETSINMIDDDMNYLIKGEIKGEIDISIKQPSIIIIELDRKYYESTTF